MLCINTQNARVVLMPSHQFQSVSFVNGVYTSLGGTHVDSWIEATLRPIVEKLSKPKGVTFTIGDIKKFFRIFVVVMVSTMVLALLLLLLGLEIESPLESWS